MVRSGSVSTGLGAVVAVDGRSGDNGLLDGAAAGAVGDGDDGGLGDGDGVVTVSDGGGVRAVGGVGSDDLGGYWVSNVSKGLMDKPNAAVDGTETICCRAIAHGSACVLEEDIL